jgi:RNA polymerase sigma factor (sigma-70 family)
MSEGTRAVSLDGAVTEPKPGQDSREQLDRALRSVIMAHAGSQEFEDIVQAVYLRLCGGPYRGEFELGLIGKALVLAVARGTMIDLRRARTAGKRGGGARPLGGDALDEAAGRGHDPVSVAERNETLTRIAGVIGKSERTDQEIFELAILRGLPSKTVAEETGLNVSTVNTRKWRLLKRLREEFCPE